MKISRIIAVIVTIFTILFVICIGPMDVFHHGFYSDVVDYDMIAAEDHLENVDLRNGAFEMTFSPIKRHFKGFELNLINQPDGNTGTLLLQIFDSSNRQVDAISVDLSKVYATMWSQVYINKELKEGEVYVLRISAGECATVPFLQIVTPDYLTDENLSGDLLMGYAYADSTFSSQEKILIFFFGMVLCGFVWAKTLEGAVGKRLKQVSLFLLFTTILSWNYLYNSMDHYADSLFVEFQSDSEKLVSGVIAAEHNGIWFEQDESGYGLGSYRDIKGYSDWNGYLMEVPALQVITNEYTEKIADLACYLEFENGDVFLITGMEEQGDYTVIRLDTDVVLTEAKYGDVRNIIFYDANMTRLAGGNLTAYKSQYGLQGKIFRHLARHMNYEGVIENLHLICAMATAAVFVMITFLIRIKYNRIFAGCYLITFWLSPWIVSFARNLYWVEFTWFLPMAAGLFCAWKIDDKGCRLCSYIFAFVAIVVKCLCGYEYITSIMMGMIIFLTADLVVVLARRDRGQAKLIFRTIFILGGVALLGFASAICIHAQMRGNGDIAKGITDIFQQDVLRRTTGTDLSEFSEELWPSFNASVWEVLCRYFHFSTEIIPGLGGNLFPVLCIVPIILLAYQEKRDVEKTALYVVSFLSAISWFCLAKAHSYIHTHMNYVLWYMGYVQVCFYIIVTGILRRWNGRRENDL